jgi:hypothetical protein
MRNWALITMLVLTSCIKEHKPDSAKIDLELSELSSSETHMNFLLQLADQDQFLRQGQSQEIVIRYGSNSKEFKSFINQMDSLDHENLARAEGYLKKFGYPKLKIFGEIATNSIWLVIHHASGYESRARNFKMLYEAYLEGDITKDAMVLFLGRMYEIKFGERMQMQNPYTAEEEIATFISKLNLEKSLQ